MSLSIQLKMGVYGLLSDWEVHKALNQLPTVPPLAGLFQNLPLSENGIV